jgi:hypothetical protein
MDQSVMTFASSGARGSAIASPTEGMITYLEDSNSLQLYNGTSWGAVDTSGSGNAIINGAFDIWQRGTSGFGLATSFNADRWRFYTGTSTNKSITRQTFTPNELNVGSFGDANFYIRFAETSATVADSNVLYTPIEDVRTFANQVVTLSFYAKSSNSLSTITPVYNQLFGTGGSSLVSTNGSSQTLTTSWARYSQTITIPSIAGKTIGAGSFLQVDLQIRTNLVQNVDIWGVQLEAGPVATPFRRNANNIQGELAACQRYYYRFVSDALFTQFGLATSRGSNLSEFSATVPVTMRVAPTAVEWSTIMVSTAAGGSSSALTAVTINSGSNSRTNPNASFTATGNLGSLGQALQVLANNSTSAFIAFSSEL